MVKYEIARQKAVDAWLDLTTPRPDPAGAHVAAEISNFEKLLKLVYVQGHGRHT